MSSSKAKPPVRKCPASNRSCKHLSYERLAYVPSHGKVMEGMGYWCEKYQIEPTLSTDCEEGMP